MHTERISYIFLKLATNILFLAMRKDLVRNT